MSFAASSGLGRKRRDGVGVRAVDGRGPCGSGRVEGRTDLARDGRGGRVVGGHPHERPVEHHRGIAGREHVGRVVDAHVADGARVRVGHQVDHHLQRLDAFGRVERRLAVRVVHRAACLLQEGHPVRRHATDALRCAVVEHPAVLAVLGELLGDAHQLHPVLGRRRDALRLERRLVVERREQGEREHHAQLLAVPGDRGEARLRQVRDEIGGQLIHEGHQEVSELRHPAGHVHDVMGVLAGREVGGHLVVELGPRRGFVHDLRGVGGLPLGERVVGGLRVRRIGDTRWRGIRRRGHERVDGRRVLCRGHSPWRAGCPRRPARPRSSRCAAGTCAASNAASRDVDRSRFLLLGQPRLHLIARALGPVTTIRLAAGRRGTTAQRWPTRAPASWHPRP